METWVGSSVCKGPHLRNQQVPRGLMEPPSVSVSAREAQGCQEGGRWEPQAWSLAPVASRSLGVGSEVC